MDLLSSARVRHASRVTSRHLGRVIGWHTLDLEAFLVARFEVLTGEQGEDSDGYERWQVEVGVRGGAHGPEAFFL